MKGVYNYSRLLTYILWQLLIIVLPTEQVKVSIKSSLDDSCIRVKGFRTLIIEKCYWKADTVDKIQENEQTFDVHPADIGEQQAMQTVETIQPFLIRLFKNSSPTSTSRRVTSCLASISSNLSVEKCELRKSRFRISARSTTKSHANICISETRHPPITQFRFQVHSSDRSCMVLLGPNSTTKSSASVGFTKCSPSKMTDNLNQRNLWQFCGEKGNCSLSPTDLNWNTLIKVESFVEPQSQSVCTELEPSTATSISPSTLASSPRTTTAETTLASTTNTTETSHTPSWEPVETETSTNPPPNKPSSDAKLPNTTNSSGSIVFWDSTYKLWIAHLCLLQTVIM